MAEEINLTQLKFCDIHPERVAHADFKTKQGPWMNGCAQCFLDNAPVGFTFGTGRGQVFVYPEGTVEGYAERMGRIDALEAKLNHDAGVNSFAAHAEGYC